MKSIHIFLFWIICTILRAPLSSTIIEAYDLKEIAAQFQQLDSQSLLLWDVDSTLIMPTDGVLRPGNEEFLDELIGLYLNGKTLQEKRWLISQIFHRNSYCLVDEGVASLIASLKEQSIPMLGLTAMRTGSYGIIESMEAWRVNQLRLLGIDFSSLLSQHDEFAWQETSPYAGKPAFKEGIICCDHLPKGVVLTSFLAKMEWRPRQVLFIDDYLDFLQSVEQAMAALDIPFVGIHYRAVEKIASPLDEELAHHQFRVLVNEEIWLHDHEAKATLVENISRHDQ